MTRSILPGLTSFWFQGASEYLEYLVAKFDAPRLDKLSIVFPHQMDFDTPHLVHFISRTPTFKGPNEANVYCDICPVVRLKTLRVEVVCDGSGQGQGLSAIAQICTKCLPPLLTVENLQFGTFSEILCLELDWNHVNRWLELLRPFATVKNLYLSEEFQSDMASVLQELVGDRTTEVLPSLQNIFLARFELSSFQRAIGQFLAARRRSGHPIAVLPL